LASAEGHFAPGAKVCVIGAFWGMGAEVVVVVGRLPKSKRCIRICMKSALLMYWRVALVLSPTVLGPIACVTSVVRARRPAPLDAIAASLASDAAPQPYTTARLSGDRPEMGLARQAAHEGRLPKVSTRWVTLQP
jgi:hypothetical protein